MSAALKQQPALSLSPFQQRVMAVPECFDMFLGGGRGGGKSYVLATLALRHCEQYGSQARVLYIRRSYRALADFELVTREVFGNAYGTAARYNAAEHVWRLPGGGYMELGQLESAADYSKYQGRSFTLLLVDEAGENPSPALLDMLRSNLRGPKDVPVRTVMAANPGGAGHAWLSRRYVFQGAPWKPFHEEQSGRQWVYCPSTFRDNTHLDQEQYQAQLRAACPTDAELLRAWLVGDWAVARGAFFGSVLEERRVAVDPWPYAPHAPLVEGGPVPGHESGRGGRRRASHGWEYYLACDYGSSAPSVTYIVAQSPGSEGPDGRYYPRGSLILLDELATYDPNDPSQGLGWTVPMQAEAILEMCERWGVPAVGAADDAIFNNNGSGAGTIADEFARAGVRFSPARKGTRLGGWEVMKRLLQNAGKPDVPGLYVSRACTYFWETVPYLGRNKTRIEDVDTHGNDHAADAVRYACIWRAPRLARKRLKGTH